MMASSNPATVLIETGIIHVLMRCKCLHVRNHFVGLTKEDLSSVPLNEIRLKLRGILPLDTLNREGVIDKIVAQLTKNEGDPFDKESDTSESSSESSEDVEDSDDDKKNGVPTTTKLFATKSCGANTRRIYASKNKKKRKQ